MTAYRAAISMTFEPDENGYLDWEGEYGLTPEQMAEDYDSKPRTIEEMKELFANELYEYILNNLEFDAIYVDEVTEE